MISLLLIKLNVTNILYTLLAVILVSFVILTLVIFSRERKYAQDLLDHSNSARIYSIDLKNGVVRYFDRNKLRLQKTVSVDSFLDQFIEQERDIVRVWLADLVNSKTDTPSYIEADIRLNRNKKVFFSFIQVQKIDYKNKIIHLESYIMKFLVSKSKIFNKGKKSITTIAQMQEMIANSKHKPHVTAVLIRFYHARLQSNPTRQVESLLLAQLKNCISPFLSQQRFMVDLTDSSIVVLDLKITSRRDVLQLAHSIEKQLSRYIDLNALHEAYEYSIGVCEYSKSDGSLSELIKKAKAASIVADNTLEHIALYDEDMQIEKNSVISFEKEIENIIKNKELRYLFRPILNMKRGTILGYSSFVKSENAIFNSVHEIKEYSYKTGSSKDLFTLVAKNVIPYYAENVESENQRLFYYISVTEVRLVIKSLSRMSDAKNVRIVLVFDEEEIYDWQHENGDISKDIDELTSKGYEVALNLKNKNLLLTSNTISIFDYFIIDGTLSGGVKKNSRMRLAIHTLVETLEQFKRPTIVMDIETWNGIELMMKSGIDYISSDVLAPYSEQLERVDKKKTLKLKSMSENNR